MDAGLFDGQHRMTNEPYPGAFTSFRMPRSRSQYGYARSVGKYAAGLAASYARNKLYGPKRPSASAQGGRPAKRRKTIPYQRRTRRLAGRTTLEPQGNGRSFTHIGVKPSIVPKASLAALPMQHYVLNNGSETTCGVGVQQIISFGLGVSSDLQTAVGKLADATSTATQMFLMDMQHQLGLTNTSTYTAKVSIYDVIARHDIATGAVPNTPTAAWSTGITDELAAGAATNIGNTPFMSDMFTQFWEIKKITKFDLQPGGTHTHKLSLKPMQKLHSELLSNITGSIGGTTCYSVIVYQGQAGHDSTTKTQVSTAATGLDVIQELHYGFKFLQMNAAHYYKANNLVNNFTVGGQVAEIINEELGELQNAAGISATAGVY